MNYPVASLQCIDVEAPGWLRLSPLRVDILKLIALAFMLCDHFNTILLGEHMWPLFLIGRGAYPLFGLLLALQLPTERDGRLRMLRRLTAWGVVTQPIYAWAFGTPWYELNIVLAFAYVVAVIVAIDGSVGERALGVLLLLLGQAAVGESSYGVMGVFFVVGVHMAIHQRGWRRGAWLSIGVCGGLLANMVAVGTLAAILVAGLALLVTWPLAGVRSERLMPRQFFYYAYAGHLMLFCIVRMLLVRG